MGRCRSPGQPRRLELRLQRLPEGLAELIAALTDLGQCMARGGAISMHNCNRSRIQIRFTCNVMTGMGL